MGEAKLIIRSAVASASDVVVVAPHDWTILRLKEHLNSAVAACPEPAKQKLIYAGKCLTDIQTVGTVLGLGSDGTPQVFHLVYTPPPAPLQPRLPAPATGLRHRFPETTPSNPSPATAPTTPPTPATPVQHAYPNYAAAWQSFIGAGGQGQHAASIQQQQADYYNAYIASYLQYMNGLYGLYGGAGAMAGAGTAGLGMGPVVAEGAGVAEAAPGVPAPNLDGPPPQPALNAQGGAADEDDQRERDWLDMLYMASRALLLTMILYFYSSIERFVLVMFCVVVMYGFNNGWFAHRGQGQAHPPQQPQAQQPQPPPQQPQGQDGNGEADGAAEEPVRQPLTLERAEAERAAAAQSPWQVFCTTCYVFITSFFASIIPERPPPVNLN